MVKPGYKQTLMGLIPEEWEVVAWEEAGSCFSSGATPYRAISRYYEGDIKWVSSGELNYNIITETLEHISEEAQKETNLTIHPINTFLMAITGLEAAGTRGSCAILGVPATTNQSCMAIYGTDKLDVKYLFYYYSSNGDDLAFKYCQGTKQQSYTASIVKKLPIILPPIDEQKKIANALSEADQLIDSLTKQLAKKKAIKQGAMQELLTGKKRLPGFTDEWKHSCLGEAAELSTTTISSKLIDSRYYVGTDNMVANRGGVMENEIILTYANIREYKVGDVLISNIRPYLKKIWYATRNGGCSNDVLVIRRKNSEELDSVFLYYILATDAFFDEIMAYAVGTKMPRGDKLVIKSYKICFPKDIFEQQAIAEILSNMDSEIEALEQKLEKYRQVKQGMMQQLLTGKIRLV